jgi:hypothetical protein
MSIGTIESTGTRLVDEAHAYVVSLSVLVGVAVLLTQPYFVQIGIFRPHNPIGVALGVILHGGLSYLLIQRALTLGQHVGLGWPPLDGWDARRSSPRVARDAVISAVLLGLAAALLVVIGSQLPSGASGLREMPHATLWAAGLASVGAGIREEVWYRLGAMTLFAWALSRLFRRAVPRLAVIWSSILAAAVLFGAAHLPQTSGVIALTPTIVAFILAGNGVVGVVCGWLYWRKGLVAAIVAHTVVDLVLKVALPLMQSWV